jgi:hypothetical protein
MDLNMNVMNVVAAVVLAGVSVSLPVADWTDKDEETQFRPLPISMSLAVEAAEAVAPGQAINAHLEVAEGRPVYEIHMWSVDHSLNIVQVDAQDGEVALVTGEEQEHTTQEEIVRPEANKEERYDLQISI